MKKLWAMMLAGMMLFSLAACGAKDDADASSDQEEAAVEATDESAEEAADDSTTEKTTLRVMIWGSVEGRDEKMANILALNPEMEEKYEIEWLLGGANDSECMEKIRMALSSGESLCDIIILNYTQVPELAKAGALVDISDAFVPYEDQITDAAKVLSQYDGKTIAVPSQVKTRLWFYRQDIFEECGIDVTQVKTTDDFIAAGQKIRETYPDSYIMNLGQQPSGYNYYLTLSGNGASFCDEEGNYNISTNEGVIKCLEDYKKIVDSGVCMDVSDWTPDWENAFANDQIVSVLSANWLSESSFLPAYAGEDDAGKWAATLWPEIGGSTGGSDAGGQVWAVPSFSEHPEEAAEFMCWYRMSEEAQTEVYKQDGNMAAIVNKNVLASDLIKENANPYFADTFVQAQIDAAGSFGVFDYTPNATAETTIVLEYFTKAVYGDMSIEDALKAAEDDLNAQIGNAYN